jgi:hypothetical protein
MPKQDEIVLEAKSEQRKNSKRVTFAALRDKNRSETEIKLTLGEDEVTMLFRALGAKEWDRLIDKHPPTTVQKAEGNSFNPDKFGPALMSKVCIDPDMTATEWSQLWTSDDWSRGEITDLYTSALKLCNQGLDIPFIATD